MPAANATPAANQVSPDVNIAGVRPGDADVQVTPTTGGGLVLSPLPVGGRKKSKKAGRRSRRRGGAEDEMAAAPVEGARRRKSKKAGRRTRRR